MDHIQCARNHMFSPLLNSCPHCEAEDYEVAKTKPYYGSQMDSKEENTASGTTRGHYAHLENDPVVGWLVCIAGPDKGRAWNLHEGRNLIARGTGKVQLNQDQEVSRSGNAIVVFEPRKNSFTIVAGEGGLSYLNGDPIHVPSALQGYDRVEMGKTTLMFVPFCGTNFVWDKN